MHQSPLDIMKYKQLVDPQSIAASSSVNSASVDMQGWDGVIFALMLGAVDGTQDMKVQDSADDSTFADITGYNITQVAATGDNKTYAIDVWRPTKRYLRVVVTNGAGAVADFQGVWSLRYRATGRLPFTQEATLGELVKKQQN